MNSGKIHILIASTDEYHSDLFSSDFGMSCTVYKARTVFEAQEILNEFEVHILIADLWLKNENGISLLEYALKHYPLVIRMFLSNCTDIDGALEAIEKTKIYQFILKPYNRLDVKQQIDEAFAFYNYRKTARNPQFPYRQFFQDVTDGILIVSQDGFIEDNNSASVNLFRFNNAIGDVKFESIFLTQVEFKFVWRSLHNRHEIIDFPVTLISLKGKTFDCLLTVIPQRHQDQLIYQCLIRAIAHQKEMASQILQAVVETQEDERIGFAKDIHDGMSLSLSSAKLLLSRLTFKDLDVKGRSILKRLDEALSITLDELKNTCFKMMPPVLEQQGLVASLKGLAKRSSLNEIIELKISDKNFPRLNHQIELAIFRIVQEFMNNSVKHGKATVVSFDFGVKETVLEIILKDNGIGFDPSKIQSKGNGLKNMQSRIHYYNGTIAFDNRSNEGANLTIKIPFKSLYLAA